MATKIPVPGSKLYWDSAGGTSYSELADLLSITPGDISTEAIDITVLSSTSRIMEFMGKSFIDAGELGFEATMDQSQWGSLKTALETGTNVTIKFAAPLLAGQSTPFSVARSAVITKLGIGRKGTGDKAVPWSYEGTMKLSGAATVVNGS